MVAPTARFDAEKRRTRVLALLQDAHPMPRIFGILNVTPDSFSDGGKFVNPENARIGAEQMLDEGADVIDIGAESTRPGAAEVSAEHEISVMVPVIRQLKACRPQCLISVDTRKSAVAAATLEAGADIINDVSGLQFDAAMADVVAEYGAGLVLMHSRGTPADMQQAENLVYDDVVAEVNRFFRRQVALAEKAGVPRALMMLDPGVGFAKTVRQNIDLLRRIDAFRALGMPLFYGVSRKSFLGEICGEPIAAERDFATAGALAWLAMKKADIVRVHNVRAARQAMTAALAVSIEETF